MNALDLEKLRRFALTVALVLITYVLAGIVIEPKARVTVFAVPFVVTLSELLPAGLAVAAFFSALRFYYYGLMLGTSP